MIIVNAPPKNSGASFFLGRGVYSRRKFIFTVFPICQNIYWSNKSIVFSILLFIAFVYFSVSDAMFIG